MKNCKIKSERVLQIYVIILQVTLKLRMYTMINT